MDEMQNAINEGRCSGESGENDWLPSAPQLSSEKAPEEATTQSPRGDQTTALDAPEQESVAERILISRFMVTRTPVNSPADTKEAPLHSPPTAEGQEANCTQPTPTPTPITTTTTTTTTTSQSTTSTFCPPPVMEGKGTPAPPHVTPETTKVSTTTTTTTTSTTTTTASQATNTEEGEKTSGVAGTQTVGE
ncbi:hypothetical protein E2C01_062977 [Portunus trituberculatus]|uniref:Uncharacterized protein n=1 Tax=Portunus trituberculatus TaxID=210409 RepID=A0A5B7HJ13_PORTR|nr:hypothetical protein [Portunus trituberculatus]